MSKFDKIIPKGSVPNCQLQIANRYDNSWFKCKLKPPKNPKWLYTNQLLIWLCPVRLQTPEWIYPNQLKISDCPQSDHYPRQRPSTLGAKYESQQYCFPPIKSDGWTKLPPSLLGAKYESQQYCFPPIKSGGWTKFHLLPFSFSEAQGSCFLLMEVVSP